MSASPLLPRFKPIVQYFFRAVLVLLFGIGAFTFGKHGLRILEAGGYPDRYDHFVTAASDPISYWLALGSNVFITAFLAFSCIVFLRTLLPPNKAQVASRDRQRAALVQSHLATQRMERELENLVDQAKREEHAK